MIPDTVTVDEPDYRDASISAAFESAAESMAHASLAPSTLAYLGARAIDAFDGPLGTLPAGATAIAGIARAGESAWIVSGREAYDLLAAMGAHICLSGHENEMGDAIDAAERRTPPDPQTSVGGMARDDENDAYEMSQVIAGRAIAGSAPPLAALTSGPERPLGEADLIRDTDFVTTRTDMASHFLAAFAIDFGDGEAEHDL